MKSFLIFGALLCAVILSSSAPSVTNAAKSATKDRAVINFDQPVKLMGTTLKGQYLFVHDDAAMARGEACTYIYKGVAENANKLVLSFHCTPAPRARVDHFTVRSSMTAPGQYELTEFQFGGSTESHLTPVGPHAH